MLEKVFVNDSMRKVMGQVAHFIDEYGLILIKCDIELLEKDIYQAKIKYKLGVREE